MIDIIVYIIIAAACAWLIFRAVSHFRRGGGTGCSCSSCPNKGDAPSSSACAGCHGCDADPKH